MSDTATSTRSCNGTGEGEIRILPSNPFRGLRFHFGQLLGVQDFQDEQGYHRGKHRIHNAWLHGDGVVWGLRVTIPELEDDTLRGEVEVASGLALDAAGNELHLSRSMCVDVGRWFEEHRGDPEFEFTEEATGDGGVEVSFDARVLARFRACLSRPVPAMTEPCEGAEADTAYSRTLETVELRLVPGLPEDEEEHAYRRLRLLFGQVAPREEDGSIVPADQEVLDARAAVAAADSEDRPAALLEAFRRLAVLDEMELGPAADDGGPTGLYPLADRPPILLATLSDVRLARASEDEPWTLLSGTVDNAVRPVHVSTSTAQDLFCCETFTSGIAADSAGPRVDPGSVELDGRELRFRVVGKLTVHSIEDTRAVAVSGFDRMNDGWQELSVEDVLYDRSSDRVTVELEDPPAEGLHLRLIVRGTGPAPVLDTDLVPLAGAVGGAAGGPHDGNDFVFMFSQGS